jgi:hypothetical protein
MDARAVHSNEHYLVYHGFESGDAKYRESMVKANELYETPSEVLQQ